MKKIAALLLLAIFFWTSCTKANDTVTHKISVSEDIVELCRLGLSPDGEPVRLNVSSNVYWKIESDADWISVDPIAGFGEDVEVNLVGTVNQGAERNAILKFSALDGTCQLLKVSQKGSDEILDYLSLHFNGISPVCSGVGIPTLTISGNDYDISNNLLCINQGGSVIMGPVKCQKGKTFKVEINVSSGNIETYVSNTPKPRFLLKEDTFEFDEPIDFYLVIKSLSNASIESVRLSESSAGAQFIALSDGKPEGYIYFEDDFSWLDSRFTSIDGIYSGDVAGEPLWSNFSSKEGFNPKGWELSPNTLKRRNYLHLGYLKWGRGSNTAGCGGGLVTPVLDIAEGRTTNLEVSFQACAFYTGTSFDAASSIIVKVSGEGRFRDTGLDNTTINFDKSAQKKAIWDSEDPDFRRQNVFDTYTLYIDGASSGTQVTFETSVETTKGRCFFGPVTIKKTGQLE